MNNSIYASFVDPVMAERATGALLDHGVKADYISVVFPGGYVSTNGHRDVTAQDIEDTGERGITTTTTEDAKSGAATGAGIGLVGGTIAALASVFVPGFGIVLGGGALAMALGAVATSTAAGAIAGGVTGYLKDQGVPEHAVEDYGRVLSAGGAMISVATPVEGVDSASITSLLEKYDGRVSSQSMSPPSTTPPPYVS